MGRLSYVHRTLHNWSCADFFRSNYQTAKGSVWKVMKALGWGMCVRIASAVRLCICLCHEQSQRHLPLYFAQSSSLFRPCEDILCVDHISKKWISRTRCHNTCKDVASAAVKLPCLDKTLSCFRRFAYRVQECASSVCVSLKCTVLSLWQKGISMYQMKYISQKIR